MKMDDKLWLQKQMLPPLDSKKNYRPRRWYPLPAGCGHRVKTIRLVWRHTKFSSFPSTEQLYRNYIARVRYLTFRAVPRWTHFWQGTKTRTTYPFFFLLILLTNTITALYSPPKHTVGRVQNENQIQTFVAVGTTRSTFGRKLIGRFVTLRRCSLATLNIRH
jgi:hypothetical protein